MNILDMMKQEEQKSNFAERMSDIFRVTESSRIRFLTDFTDGTGLYWHKNFDDQVDGPCYKQFDLDCPHCQADEKKTRRNTPVYAFAVYDYDRDRPLVLHGRDHEKTIVGKVKVYWAKKKTLHGRDFYVDKTGEKMSTIYGVVADDPSEFQFADVFPGLDSANTMARLQECIRRTLVLSFDPDLAEQLGYKAGDKLAQFFASGKLLASSGNGAKKAAKAPARQVVRKPAQAVIEDDITFEDED